MRGRFVLAASGDLIGPHRPVGPLEEPGTLEALAPFRRADVGYANLEGSAFELADFRGYPAAENGGGYPLYEPAALADLSALGVNLLGTANNHSSDWGAEGLLATLASLRTERIAHAGTGASLAAAQLPGYLETPLGRLALISLATTFVGLGRAGESGGVFAPRPGLFAYRVTAVNQLPHDVFASLAGAVQQQTGTNGWMDSRVWTDGNRMQIGDEIFEAADAAGLTYDVHPRDHADLVKAVRFAKQTADLVVVAVHCHETRSGGGDDREPPEFLVDLYRAAVDAGADVGVTTGYHVPRGVEIYRGKPILYGLASLFLEMEYGFGLHPDILRARSSTVSELTPGEAVHGVFDLPDEWYDGVVAEITFDSASLESVRLYPLRLTKFDEIREMGRPQPAAGADAARILRRLHEDCRRLGTDMDIVDGVGVIEPH